MLHRVTESTLSCCCRKAYAIFCCLEGSCSAVFGTGVDLTGILYSIGIPYFKKDEVEENLEKATAGWGGWVGRGEKKRAMENRTH